MGTEFQVLITGSITAISQTIDLTSPNTGTSIVQLTGTWVGTLVVEGSNDGVTYYPIETLDRTTNLLLASITTNGSYTCNTNGFNTLRIISSAWTSGTATVNVYGSDSSSLIRVLQASSPWNQNITQVGGSALALGQTTMAASLPVTLSSNQTALPVSQSGTWNIGTLTGITNPVAVTQSTSPWVVSGTVTAAEDKNYGTVGANTIRAAAQIGNATGASDFGAGTTSAQTLRVVLPTNQTAIPASQSGTWTVQQGTPPWSVGGNVASAATDSGNPVKIGAVFLTTQPTVTNNQRVNLQATNRGALIVSTGVDSFNINNITGTISLPTGAATSALQTTGNASLASIDTKLTSPLSVTGPLTDVQLRATPVPVSGSVSVSNFPATQAVTQSTSPWVVSGTITSAEDKDYGTVGAATLRTAAQIGNATGAAAFGTGTTDAQTLRVVIPTDQTAIPSSQSGSWTVAATQSGTWNIGTLASITNPVAVTQSTSPWVVSGTVTANAGTGTFAISAASLPLPTGAATSALQTTGNASLASIDSKLTSPLAVTGPLTDAQLRATPVPVSGTVAATQSGTWTVQPGNTANTTPWLTKDNSDGPVTPGAVAVNSGLIGGQYNTTLPTLTNGQQAAIQVDSSGRVLTTANSDRIGTDTITALNDAVLVNSNACSTVAVTITGTWVATLIFEATVDNTNWFTIDGVLRPSNTLATTTTTNTSVIFESGGFAQVRVRASLFTSGTATIAFVASSAVNLEDATYGNNSQTAPVQSQLIAGLEPDSGNMYPLKVDNEGRLVTSALTGFGANFTFGDITTAALTRVLVNRTAYTEQTTNAQRSIASASANDTAAGTGARTVKITYFDQTGAGPFTETVTLNGITYVNTVATNICFIEQIDVITAGSTGSNVGILTLKAATAGGGATIGTVNATNNQTFWTHHYVATGKTCNITGISSGHNGTTVGSGALFTLNAQPIGVANAVETQVSDFVRLYGQTSTFSRNYTSPIKVVGPARIRAYVTPETASSTIYRCAFDFFEP
jgi:hypothetical protein